MTQWFYSGTVMDKEKRKQEVGIYFYLKKISKQLSVSRENQIFLSCQKKLYLPKNKLDNAVPIYYLVFLYLTRLLN